MAMAWIFTAMIVISVVFGMVNGTMDAVSTAALSGANDAITLTISLLGVLCLWSGVLEVMDQSGLSKKLAAAFCEAVEGNGVCDGRFAVVFP